jgi:exodeoxyribonuclease VII large subunit
VVGAQSRADGLREKLLYRNPHKRVEEYELRVSRLTRDLGDAIGRRISERESRVGQLVSNLDNLSPLAILKRGYSITRKYPTNELVKDAQAVAKGDRVRVKFYRGEILCEVEECGLP